MTVGMKNVFHFWNDPLENVSTCRASTVLFFFFNNNTNSPNTKNKPHLDSGSIWPR